MTFNPRPKPSGDTLVLSRDQIRTNFEVLQSRFEDNHAEYGTGDGKHTRVDLVEQTVFPSTAANESWASSREYNSRTELIWRPESEAAGGDQFFLSAMPIRASAHFEIKNGTIDTYFGRSFNIGSISRSSNLYTVTFATALPSGVTNYFMLGLSQATSAIASSRINIGIIYTGTVDENGFTFFGDNTNGNRLYFVVVGG